MVDDQQVFEAARQGYVEGATEDPKWIRIYQESVDKVLASLTDREQAKLLGYIGQFTSRAAVRIVREMVNVYALLLDEPDDIYKQESARKSLEEFRQDYISGSVGQEEGKRSSDAPHTVYQAAIRRLWASERPYFRQRLTGRIDQALNSFSDVERQAVLNFFESCPVVAVESIVLRWAWVDDEQTRSSFVRQQAEGWKAQGDDAPWFDWPSREDPLWRPVSNSSKRVFEQALDRYLVNRTRPMPGMRMHTRFEIGRALEAFSGVEREQVLACFDKYSVEQIEQVVDQWSYGMIAGFPDYFREQYQKWTSTGDDTVWFPETDRFSLSQVPPTAEDTVVEALLLSGQKTAWFPRI